jgi:hypothetical protein
MRIAAALLALACAACGSAAATPVASPPVTPAASPSATPAANPLGTVGLRYSLVDSIGRPAFCDPDFYPVARPESELANAIAAYPSIVADAETYSAIVAHEHLPAIDLTDAEKLQVYRAWKLLRALTLTPSGSRYTFQYRALVAAGSYQMVAGSIGLDGQISITSRVPSGAPPCPICLAASTLIATPHGPVLVTEIRVGTVVWTEDSHGTRVAEPVIEIGSTPVPPSHLMVHLVLADGRELLASPGHRTGGGVQLGALSAGTQLDGSTIALWELVPYASERTYDLLPKGATGDYWADGILLASTLKP